MLSIDDILKKIDDDFRANKIGWNMAEFGNSSTLEYNLVCYLIYYIGFHKTVPVKIIFYENPFILSYKYTKEEVEIIMEKITNYSQECRKRLKTKI